MDTVTHALVGAAIADCHFRKRFGPLATPFALAAAALPDVDAVTYLISAESALANHRGYTHSFLILLLAAPLLGWVGHALSGKRGEWKEWCLFALLCLFSHTLFDLLTSWGTMPLLPFSNARISWDVLPIIDIFLLAVAGGSFILNRILRWERVDTFINPLIYPVVHRHPGRQRVGDWMGKIATALIVVYVLIGWQQNRQAVRIATEALTQRGVTPTEVRALPILLTYIAYDIAARDESGTVHNAVHSSYAPKEMTFLAYPTLPREEAGEEYASPEGQFFAWFTQNMFVARKEESGVVFHDRRFFMLSEEYESRFAMEFQYGADGTPSGASFCRHSWRGVNFKEELNRLWRLTWEGAE